ncbi:peptidylprolyl isomerase [Marinifilum sp. D714]|uniref:peptidylprolyl isomerase n=1 Tax=Marinifilum sp. D714 TaxID=2937523 RepID=UPI0027C71A1C|nr:peptidylprolyl isomerase [Marinifilum sp. D714]MDQ2179405.1 peptidylprolyl isomerase [Marinifilum sp. D714]
MKKLLYLTFILAMVSCQQKLELGKKNRIVEIETEYGDIKIKLYDETPLHRDNFVKLAHANYFDGTLFHRVIDGFMIQGGDPDSKAAKPGVRLGEGGPGYQIDAEFNPTLFHKRGVIAAAREGDAVNPQKKSSGSQFYLAQGKVYTQGGLDTLLMKLNDRVKNQIFEKAQKNKATEIMKFQSEGDMDKVSELIDQIQVEVDSVFATQQVKFTQDQIDAYTTVGGIPHLDGNYTVFGEVIEGIEFIDSIAKVKRDEFDRPLEDVTMKIKIVQ